MIPLADRPKSKQDNAKTHINKLYAHPMPIDACQGDTELAAVVASWPTLPEAIKAGIMAMVKAAALPPSPPPRVKGVAMKTVTIRCDRCGESIETGASPRGLGSRIDSPDLAD